MKRYVVRIPPPGTRPVEPALAEKVAGSTGAVSPGVPQRRSLQPRERDWNSRLRDSLTGGRGGAPTWRG
ncbi:MAG: hypothetical protein ACJ750_03700 [Gaiellaceae bacterium]